MNNRSEKTQSDLLNETFGESRADIEKAVRRRYRRSNPAAYIDMVAERAAIASYEYYMAKLVNQDACALDECTTPEEVLGRLKQKAISSATDQLRRKARSCIAHGILDAPGCGGEGTSNLEYFESTRAVQGEDEARLQEMLERISELPEEDGQLLAMVVDAQADKNSPRIPYKAIAEELGVSTHQVQYRWKKIRARLADSFREYKA